MDNLAPFPIAKKRLPAPMHDQGSICQPIKNMPQESLWNDIEAIVTLFFLQGAIPELSFTESREGFGCLRIFSPFCRITFHADRVRSLPMYQGSSLYRLFSIFAAPSGTSATYTHCIAGTTDASSA